MGLSKDPRRTKVERRRLPGPHRVIVGDQGPSTARMGDPLPRQGMHAGAVGRQVRQGGLGGWLTFGEEAEGLQVLHYVGGLVGDEQQKEGLDRLVHISVGGVWYTNKVCQVRIGGAPLLPVGKGGSRHVDTKTTCLTVSVSMKVCCFSSPDPMSLGKAAKRPCERRKGVRSTTDRSRITPLMVLKTPPVIEPPTASRAGLLPRS